MFSKSIGKNNSSKKENILIELLLRPKYYTCDKIKQERRQALLKYSLMLG
jgi:hypothetical protein